MSCEATAPGRPAMPCWCYPHHSKGQLAVKEDGPDVCSWAFK